MSTSDPTHRLNEHRDFTTSAHLAVHDAARRLASQYTKLALNHAAALLGDLYAAGARHGIPLREWDAVTDLASACLSVVGIKFRADIPTTSEGAVELLDAVATALNQRGVPANRDVLTVAVPRQAETPAWGPRGTTRLAVSMAIDCGWAFVLDLPSRTPVVTVAAPLDVTGADAVAALALEVVAGVHGNPFRS